MGAPTLEKRGRRRTLDPRLDALATRAHPDNPSHRAKWLTSVAYLRATVGWRGDVVPLPKREPQS